MNRHKPNLLFVFSDQQSWDMLACAGNPRIKTPNLDAFAAQGIRFEHAVANCPVCTPFRSMLISGRHPLYNNCFDNDRRLLDEYQIGPGIGHVLRDAGYRMGYVGKWHLYGGDRDRPIPAGPDRHGFDDLFLSNNCHVNYDPDHSYYWTGNGEKVGFHTWEVGGQTDQALAFLDSVAPGAAWLPEEKESEHSTSNAQHPTSNDDGHSTSQDSSNSRLNVGRSALDVRLQGPEAPFCLFVSWHAPHNHGGGDAEKYSEFDAPEAFKALYNEDAIIPRGHLADTAENRRMTLGYYAMCSEVDYHFGRLMDKLKEKGLDDNTLVVFSSDHGETFGAHAAKCHKGNPMDVSVRIPLLMRFPGVLDNGRVSQLLIGGLDMAPTILGLMGHTIPANWQGLNLADPILSGNDDAVQSVPIFNFKPSWRGVYTRRHTFAIENIERTPDLHTIFGSDLHVRQKYTPSFNIFYDRDTDPLQLNNLINSTAHVELAWELTQQTHAWCAKFRDPFNSYQSLIDQVGEREDVPPINMVAPACSKK